MRHHYVNPEEMDDHIKQEVYLASKLAGRLWGTLGDFMRSHEDRGACISVPLMAFQIIEEGYKELMQIDPEDISSVNTGELGVDFEDIAKTLMIELEQEKKDGEQKL